MVGRLMHIFDDWIFSMPSTKWPPATYDSLLAEFGRIIFNFNCLERGTRALLWALASRDQQDQKHHALATHLSITAMLDALRTVANDFHKGEIRESAIHCISVFDVAREYRNFYVHGFANIKTNGNGSLHTAVARKKLADIWVDVTVKDVEWVANLCSDAHHYVAGVFGYASEQLGRLKVDNGIPRVLPAPLVLPERLKKDYRYRISE